MAAQSRRKAIIQAFLDRLESILTSNLAEDGRAFNTNAGACVYLNEKPTLGDDDPDVAIAVMVQDDEVGFQGEHKVIVLPIEIEAHAKIGSEKGAAFLAAEDVLEDIKRAVETTDRTMGRTVRRQIECGTTRTLPRETGSRSCGVVIGYRAPYLELWGRP